MSTNHPITLGIAGAGWRTKFFLRIARELPERFSVAGVVARDAAKGEALTAEWGVPTFRTLEELQNAAPLRYVIASVPWEVSPGLLTECAERGLAVLAETPPAPDLPRLEALWELVQRGAKIQVAEQYAYQPLHQALLAAAHGGKIGTPSQVQVAIAHGYHGISLLRRYLGVRFEEVAITASKVTTPLVRSPGREGPPDTEQVGNSGQTIAHFRFDDGRFGIFDFTGDQYFSFVRGPRLLVRGERGEIVMEPSGEGALVRFLLGPDAAVSEEVRRVDTGHGGNLEGYHHRGYTFGGEWIYRNPFAARSGGYVGGRLSDDELAIATMMEGMAAYADGTGPDVYSLAEAAQDRYLDTLMEEAARSGSVVRSETRAWAGNL